MYKPRLIAAMVLLATQASAQEMPSMKPGLWESTTSTRMGGSVKSGPKTMMCINEAMQRLMLANSQRAGAFCGKNITRREGNQFIAEAECRVSGATLKSQSIAIFTGDTAFRVESSSTVSPPISGINDSSATQEARYVGPCPAGMKPGDITSGGRTMNMLDFAKGAEGSEGSQP